MHHLPSMHGHVMWYITSIDAWSFHKVLPVLSMHGHVILYITNDHIIWYITYHPCYMILALSSLLLMQYWLIMNEQSATRKGWKFGLWLRTATTTGTEPPLSAWSFNHSGSNCMIFWSVERWDTVCSKEKAGGGKSVFLKYIIIESKLQFRRWEFRNIRPITIICIMYAFPEDSERRTRCIW